MIKLSKHLISLAAVALLGSCTYDFPEPDPATIPSAGTTADFSNYVAIGNSLTAGFMDNALYNRSQINSFPNILAQQMQLVGGGDFQQPDINSVDGFGGIGPNGIILGRLRLVQQAGGSPFPSPTTTGDLIGGYDGATNELNNFGIPGIKIIHLQAPQLGNSVTSGGNPFYNRIASNPGVSTLLEDFISADPTFFTFWVGSNDVLGYAFDRRLQALMVV